MRMSGIEGAVLKLKLKYLDSWNQKRLAISKKYLSDINNNKISLPVTIIHTESVFHLFVITSNHRDDLERYLIEKGIYTGKHYPIPCHLQKAYQFLGHKVGDFPNFYIYLNHCLSLPIFPEMEDKMVEKVIDELNKF